MLLTRSPLTHPSKNQDRPVRLACVKHAASVRPEPGSNSPKKTKNKTNQPQATTTHTPTNKPGHAHQQPTTRKTKTNQKTRTAHPQRHKTPHNHHHKQRSSNHTRPHNATDRPWHKKQAHYRDLKQHTHEVSRGISVLLRPSRRPGQNKQADPLRSSPRACDPRRSTLEDPPCDYRKSFPVRRRQGRNPSRQQEG